MPSSRIKPSHTSIIAFVLIVLPVLYVLSYAPFVRASRGRYSARRTHRMSVLDPDDVVLPGAGSRYPAYKPVDWLVDNTVLTEPLLLWSGLWGVREYFEHDTLLRESERAMEEAFGRQRQRTYLP